MPTLPSCARSDDGSVAITTIGTMKKQIRLIGATIFVRAGQSPLLLAPFPSLEWTVVFTQRQRRLDDFDEDDRLFDVPRIQQR